MKIVARRPLTGNVSPSDAKDGGETVANEDKLKFWRRPPNAELDRAGDWLLENLTVIRAETIARDE